MNKKSRTENSLINILVSMISNSVSIVIGLIAQAVFIKLLGSEFLGLNGLFSNVISMLGIVELGIGNAIIYNLYKPISKNDHETIKSLMKFYKKSYHIIGIVVLILGIGIMPFLGYIVGNVNLPINVNVVYLLFLADIVFSYFLSYKRSILYANQKEYIVQSIHIVYLVVMNTLQLVFLYLTKNYYIYLCIKVLMRIIENMCITFFVNYKYAYLKEKNVKKIDKLIERDIFKKVKALFLHQIGAFAINGTDNLVISRYIGLTSVGLYSNYYLIINAVQTVSSQIISATTPSIGNMLSVEKKEKFFPVFKKMRFLNFYMATFCAICIFCLMEPFIKIWIGKGYLLETIILLILTINFYQKTSRLTYKSFKTAAGIFYEDRFVPIIEALMNIIISIVLAKKIGLAGVFIGTIVSGFALWCYSYPKYVYKKLFNRGFFNYICETIGYLLLFLFSLFVTNFVIGFVKVDNLILQLMYRFIICLIVPNVILITIFFKTDNFKYYMGLLGKLPIIRKVLRRKKEVK